MIHAYLTLLIGIFCAQIAAADTLFAVRTISPNTILTYDDLVVQSTAKEGAFSDPSQVVGLETRKAIYPGRPIQSADVGPPALVVRNGQVRLKYQVSGLEIITEGRSLERAALGDVVRVMNIASRTIVLGVVQQDGSVFVRQ
ncbi:flagellar basal body P-ring formation chaperone FlgA [Algirhabdus cladophorae]|uniref:flagellar basal body P-ring formation chaperone FlgA n=1 Tax=Algirhabdus cladophorae TaxID=3377108 RepID=UPI003B849523